MSNYSWDGLGGWHSLKLLLGLAAGVLALFFGAASAGVALADEGETPEGPELPLDPEETGIQCNGKVLKSDDRDYPFDYSFKCNREVRTYSIISNREIDGTDSEPVALDPNGDPDVGVPANPDTTPPTPAIPAGDFFCISSLPGWGFSCHGRRGQATLKTGYTMKAGFSTFNPICEANSQPQFWVVPVYEYSEENNLVSPPVIRKWLIAAEPIALNASAVRCKVLNPSVKAKKACAKVKRLKGKAKEKAKAECRKARAAVQASR